MVEPIDRAGDPRLDDYRHVGDPTWLSQRGLFVAEGRLVLQRLLETRRFEVRSILLTPAAHRALALPPLDVPIYIAAPDLLNDVTGFNFHRGCLAIASRSRPVATAELLTGRRLLALEGVGNPDNVGGLFRVAAAFGVNGILLDQTSADPLYRKAIRTSMAAALSVPFARDEAWPSSIEACQAAGFKVLALTPRPAAMPLASLVLAAGQRWLLMAGAEGAGLSEAAMARADVLLRIPIDPSVDSLNVTVATGIALAVLSGAAR